MRIAGNTIRRNYLARYEKNYSDKYKSESKIESGRKFVRASESPIDAAQALRIRRSISEAETYQANLKSADTIYTNADSAMQTLSGIIQSVYEKLVEGAHGTRNQDDLNIIAMEIDNYAEEMVQSLNIDVADRKIFGGLNNDTVAFAIEDSGFGDKYVTYNGVAVNSSSDPHSFPYDGESYLDIGIGMTTDGLTDRIDDQTGLPITFSGVECTGCGVTNRTAVIDLENMMPGAAYKINVAVGGELKTVEFNGGDTQEQSIENINAALKNAFIKTPQVAADGTFKYIENIEGQEGGAVARNYENAPIDDTTKAVDLNALKPDTYYSFEITSNGKTRVIDFMGTDNINTTLDNIRKSLDDKFGKDAPNIYTDGVFRDAQNEASDVKNTSDYSNNVPIISDGQIDLSSLTDGENYTINLNGTKVTFTAGADVDETVKNLNDVLASPSTFGEPLVPKVMPGGTIVYDKPESSIVIDNAPDAENQLGYAEVKGYAKNVIQLVLDSAKLLREGDQDMVARYADLIYAAQGPLSMAIADLGTHEKFIEFNQNRIADTLINLSDRQNDLEITDLPSEITNYKVLESVYNATLQMGSQFLSTSIFDYIK